jgi:hypothetical protein
VIQDKMDAESIVQAFANVSTKLPKDVVAPCTALAQKLKLTNANVDVLTDEWEVYSMKKGGEVKLDKESFKEFAQSPGVLQLLNQAGGGVTTGMDDSFSAAGAGGYVTPSPKKRLRDAKNKAAVGTNAKKVTIVSPSDAAQDVPMSIGGSPFLDSLIKARPASGTKYKDRKDSGKVVTSYKELSLAQMSSNDISDRTGSCVISTNKFSKTNVQKPYRYGFTPMEKKAAALDDHLLDLQDSMLAHLSHEIDEDLMESVGVPCQETVVCFGRICTDVSRATQKIQ